MNSALHNLRNSSTLWLLLMILTEIQGYISTRIMKNTTHVVLKRRVKRIFLKRYMMIKIKLYILDQGTFVSKSYYIS